LKAVIMAGGKGTRLAELTKDEIPKPLAPVNGKPIIQHQIERLCENDICDICVVVGHLGEKIVEFLGDGSQLRVNIVYYRESEPLGTAGALGEIGDFYNGEDFLLVFGDTIFDIDLARFISYHIEKKSKATLFVHPNSHPYDSDLVVCGNDGAVLRFDSKNNARGYWYRNLVNAGLYVLSPSVVSRVSGKTDLEKDILSNLLSEVKIYGYRSSEYIKDVGTIERIRQVERDLASGTVSARNLSRPQKAVFLDRDGTLNYNMDSAISVEAFKLYDETPEAVKLINESGYLAIIVTNQPMIAKGFITFSDLDEIHAKMETQLGKSGAYIDDIYYCPHHPEKGFEGEIPELKIVCNCRKPKPGMLLQAAEDYNIDLSASYMIGDGDWDMEAGQSAGCKTIRIDSGTNILDAVKRTLAA